MSPAQKAAAALPEADAARVREGVADAIVGGPDGLRRTLQSDPASFLALVAAARVGADEADRLLHQAVTGARQAGHSWEAIGSLLGVSRQAAQQRFAAAPGGARDTRGAEDARGARDARGAAGEAGAAEDPAAAERRVLTGVTAFTEMALLEAEGARGWHLVGFGPLYLVVERSPQRWAHRRLTLPSRASQRRLERDGWVAVGTWFPFRYFKRALGAVPDAPAEPTG